MNTNTVHYFAMNEFYPEEKVARLDKLIRLFKPKGYTAYIRSGNRELTLELLVDWINSPKAEEFLSNHSNGSSIKTVYNSQANRLLLSYDYTVAEDDLFFEMELIEQIEIIYLDNHLF